jgi:hypothetical protein
MLDMARRGFRLDFERCVTRIRPRTYGSLVYPIKRRGAPKRFDPANCFILVGDVDHGPH